MFTHLNTHSKGSLLFSAIKIENLINKAQSFNQNAIALTDYSNIFNSIRFYKQAHISGIKPILGATIFFCEDVGEYRQQQIRDIKHLVLLAENKNGWKNIVRLISKAHDNEYFYFYPRVDFKLLSQYSDGIICLSGNIHDSVISNYLFDKRDQYGDVTNIAAPFKAEALLRRLLKIFDKEHFYLEVQGINHYPYLEVNDKLRKIAKKYNLRTVATNSVHYIEQADAEAHKTLCSMAGQYIRPTKIEFNNDEYYFKSLQDMQKANILDGELQLTNEIAERCNVSLDLKKHRLPKYKFIPQNKSSIEYLTELSNSGLNRLGLLNKKEYKDRLREELYDIQEMGFADYFLIVHDVINWCKRQNIALGFGRGSVGGSVVAYCLGLTEVDPIRYGLIWERFLNKGRGGLPDIDSDVSKLRRQEVLGYIKERFGDVAQIVTFSGLQAKAILKEVFRYYKMSFEEANRITALVPAKNEDHSQISLDSAIERVSELQIYEKKYKPWFQIARSLEGSYKTTGVHAGGVVIPDVPFEDSEYPLSRAKDGNLVFGWDMDTVDDLHLLKLDILGLNTLDEIQLTRNLINQHKGISTDRKSMPLDDSKTFQLLCDGLTAGIFQLETQLGKQWCRKIQPKTIQDISDINTILRPGPGDSGMREQYLANKNSNKNIPIHSLLKDITSNTWGQLLYQEQVLFALQKLAKWDLQKADLARAAMGKKKIKEMKKLRKEFIQDCINNNVVKNEAKDLWEKIEKFAGYSFNFAHSLEYSLLGYETAYLKANYPLEFFCSKLRLSQGHPDKFERISSLISDAKLFDIQVSPPRLGFEDFTIVDNKTIAFGIASIKQVGNAVIRKLSLLKDMPVDDILLKVSKPKSGVNSGAFEALVKSGVFDHLKEDRVRILSKFKLLSQLTPREKDILCLKKQDFITTIKELANGTATDIKLPNKSRRKILLNIIQEYNSQDLFDDQVKKIAWEKEYLGIPLSGSESDIFQSKDSCIDIIKDDEVDTQYEITVCLDSIKQIYTKQGNPMAFLTGRDNTYILDSIVVFPKVYEKTQEFLTEGTIVKINGKLNDRHSFIANTIERLV